MGLFTPDQGRLQQLAAQHPERYVVGPDGTIRRKTSQERVVEEQVRKQARREGWSERQVQAEIAARLVRIAAMKAERDALQPVARFSALGVQVMDDGDVYTFNGFGGKGSRLGPAAGAHAELGAERKRHRVSGAVASTAVLGPVGLLGAAGKKSKATTFVVLADGTLHEKNHDGNMAVTQAQREVVRFNATVMKYGEN